MSAKLQVKDFEILELGNLVVGQVENFECKPTIYPDPDSYRDYRDVG